MASRTQLLDLLQRKLSSIDSSITELAEEFDARRDHDLGFCGNSIRKLSSNVETLSRISYNLLHTFGECGLKSDQALHDISKLLDTAKDRATELIRRFGEKREEVRRVNGPGGYGTIILEEMDDGWTVERLDNPDYEPHANRPFVLYNECKYTRNFFLFKCFAYKVLLSYRHGLQC